MITPSLAKKEGHSVSIAREAIGLFDTSTTSRRRCSAFGEALACPFPAARCGSRGGRRDAGGKMKGIRWLELLVSRGSRSRLWGDIGRVDGFVRRGWQVKEDGDDEQRPVSYSVRHNDSAFPVCFYLPAGCLSVCLCLCLCLCL